MYLKSYKELIVWQKSVQLVKEIFLLTENFPRSEIYGIISQMIRAAVAMPSNIAEGYGRYSSKEYRQFFSIAYGSALELETQLIISKELSLAKDDHSLSSQQLLEEILKMLNSMLSKMKLKLNAKN